MATATLPNEQLTGRRSEMGGGLFIKGNTMTTSSSTAAAWPAQLEFEFMRTMPLQLNPTGFAALRKSVGGGRPIAVTRSSS
jgi:hypothetical protein